MSTNFYQFKNISKQFVPVLMIAFTASASFASSTVNSGSLLLSDLNQELINQSPKLQQEINLALKEAKKDDVGCIAPILRAPFRNERVAPFTCYFTKNKKLIIRAKNFAKLPNGKKVPVEELLGKSAPDGTTLGFELKSWKWSKG